MSRLCKAFSDTHSQSMGGKDESKTVCLVTLISNFFVFHAAFASFVTLDMNSLPDTNSVRGLYDTGSASVSAWYANSRFFELLRVFPVWAWW
jgi:hypothetical protein